MEKSDLLLLTTKARADKAISTLKGILLGIIADNNLNSKEIEELNNWVQLHHDIVYRNPFREFMKLIVNSTIDNSISIDTIDDLYWLCQKYESDTYYYNPITGDLQILQGICHGLLSDGVLHDDEIYKLEEWLVQNEHLNTYYPYDEIRSLILSITSDHKIDKEERLLLMAYFNQFVNIATTQTATQINLDTSETRISALCTSEPNVSFDGTVFCFTGIMKRIGREQLKSKVTELGGVVTDSITKKTDYLIVGDDGNQAWAFACYGRKVERALSLRKEGHVIMIIHEYDFADIIDDLI